MPSELTMLYELIRLHVMAAVAKESAIGPFKLGGRGHEPRVTLDRRIAGVLRGQPVPNIDITGYSGARYFPERVFVRAKKTLEEVLGFPILLVGSSVYVDSTPEMLKAQRQKLKAALLTIKSPTAIPRKNTT